MSILEQFLESIISKHNLCIYLMADLNINLLKHTDKNLSELL